MGKSKETPEKQHTSFDWGDGTIITVKKPRLLEIPGESVVCPSACFPIGEDPEEWGKEKKENGKHMGI